MSRCRKMLLRLLHSWKRVQSSAILRLEESTLQKIYHHHSLVDRVCLSLSCKDLFGLFGTIAKHKDLEFPRLLRIRNPILCVNSKYVPRNQLLLRLENRRWAYCAQCLKLHPRKEFTRHSLRQSALVRSCTYYAGIGDLCPFCRDQLVKILKSPAKPAKTKYGPFEYNFDDERTAQPWPLDLVLFIKEPTGQLCVAARHTISFSSSDARLTAEPTFPCPHQDLLSLVPRNQAAEDLLQMYQTLTFSKPHQDILPLVPGKLVSKALVRNLGSCQWPAGRPWLGQCRLTGAWFSHNEKYW
ncbi:uncharacterized protein P174DRAFT_458679 [Aspergillus novofumigatus IBT 16806]|uniref:F-box domain protein n=1 Tax=Aspergillus novofumigatus (strain IBT 16806) TaxID=1392255 RepID=A0A2I1CBS6_ASPN1|nr:uncharacterized protein P174DRAFT_458679 [Aspergillus novofumigatus IBT 16806]PKX95085.1 hypothetical protein P174DRAFT_458679 [Aspergillus novofumigatus IBT 16806]